MKIDHINHLVLTVKDVEETCTFYRDILGMEVEIFSARRRALKFGDQRFHLHQKNIRFEPEAESPTPGSMEIGFKVQQSVEQIKAELEKQNIPIEGIVQRPGATGKVTSIYFRDPDQNLIEVSSNT